MKKILIIEDEVQLNNALKQALESAGFKVEQAYNGQEAIEIANSNGYDIILLDLVMPVKDGFSFLEEYMATTEDPSPVLVLTNLSDFTSQMRTYKKGIVSYMVKSNTPLEEVVKKVTNMVI